MDCEEEVESKKKLDGQRKRLQKQLRELEKNHVYVAGHSEQAQGRVATAATAHWSQKMQSIQDNKRNMHKESVAAEEEMRKVREVIRQREERFLQLSKKVESNRVATAELEE